MDDQKTIVVSVHAKDCVDYQCRRCGQCCRHIKDSLMVESLDAYRLANYLRGCDPNICTIDDVLTRYCEPTCVELNPHYVEVGKKVVSEATWICADVLDPFLPDLLGQFDFAIANPPFGRIANNYRKSYISGEFEYMVIEAASRIAKEGAFIIPQMSAPFVYSGTEDHRWLQEGRARTFEKRTGILLEFNQGIDTAYYKNDWHCTAPICEIVCCDFAGTDTSAA